ncbi:Conidiation protein 6-domain-containing protein [Parachaetomium inaequale]|uniref:Conidiation protein 6-domain-containing protein n=1 Tax=Parachaetomium inaequale TaxID=2588326 RepID=A0AAN6SMP8_9PEZI|nr:Conidiation protein 6-domain-containing protein [Parachaetomium inaequale]
MAEARNRERGLKAAIHNPRVSEEAKQHDRDLLASEFGEEVEEPQAQPKRRSSAGKKSSSTGPHSHATEGQAQQASSTGVEKGQASGRKARRASVGEAAGLQQMTEEKDKGNVIRGLKAALKNPHVSEKAKEADRKKLKDLGETVE